MNWKWSFEIFNSSWAQVFDFRPVLESVAQTGRMLVVDEDYRRFGLSGELAAVAMEAGVKASYARVCTESTIPFARDLAEKAVPHTRNILEAARRLVGA